MSNPSRVQGGDDSPIFEKERYQHDMKLVHAFTEALYDHEVRLERHLGRIVCEASKASSAQQPSMWVRAYLVILLCIGVTALLGLNYVLLYPFLQTLFWVIVAYLLLYPPKQLIKSALLTVFHIPQASAVREAREWSFDRRSASSGSPCQEDIRVSSPGQGGDETIQVEGVSCLVHKRRRATGIDNTSLQVYQLRSG